MKRPNIVSLELAYGYDDQFRVTFDRDVIVMVNSEERTLHKGQDGRIVAKDEIDAYSVINGLIKSRKIKGK
jgi:hypothetical protein